MRTILCASDFSEASARALDHAAALAEKTGARLVLLHVHEPSVLGVSPELGASYLELDQQIFRSSEERMAARVASLRSRLPTVEGSVVRGFAPRWIVAHADAIEADLVVMATTGHSELVHVLLGSVADRVLRQLRRPLLLVPNDGRAVSAVPRRILVPTDFSEPARAAIREAIAWSGELGSEVEVLHAYDLAAYVLRSPGLADDVRRAVASTVDEELAKIADGRAATARAVESDPQRAILDASEAGGVDLIVMGATGRSAVSAMLGGVTDKIVRASRVPVLVVRAPQDAR